MYKKTCKITVVYSSFFTFMDLKREDDSELIAGSYSRVLSVHNFFLVASYAGNRKPWMKRIVTESLWAKECLEKHQGLVPRTVLEPNTREKCGDPQLRDWPKLWCCGMPADLRRTCTTLMWWVGLQKGSVQLLCSVWAETCENRSFWTECCKLRSVFV